MGGSVEEKLFGINTDREGACCGINDRCPRAGIPVNPAGGMDDGGAGGRTKGKAFAAQASANGKDGGWGGAEKIKTF